MRDRRVVFPAQNVVEIESFELDSSPPGPHEIVVESRVTLLSPGTELALLQGKLAFEDDDPPVYPMTSVGYANIGTVLAAGSETQVQPGDRVYTMGAHASRDRLDVRTRLCVPVPEGLADDLAVMTRLATVSMTTMITTIARPGDAVAVVGLGLVGNLAAQVFQASGMRVHAFDLDANRRDIATRAGILTVRDGSAMPEFSQQHRLVIEASGSARALASSIDLAAPGGEIVMIGAPWGGRANSVLSSDLTRLIFLRFLTLRSGSEWEIPRLPQPLVSGSNYQNSVTALDWIARGLLLVEPLVTHRIRPEDVPAAYAGLATSPGKYLGVVVDWAAHRD